MGEAPSKGPGNTLSELIHTAETILRDKKFHNSPAATSSRVEKGIFDLDAEVGALLAGLAGIRVDHRVDDHEIHEICGLLFDLTGKRAGDTERFSEYINRLRALRVTATRARVASTISPVPATALRQAVSPAPARPIPPTLRGSSRSPVPATVPRAVPPPVPQGRTSAPSPAPDYNARPNRVPVVIGGSVTYITRREVPPTVIPTPPSPARPVSVPSANTVSPVQATVPRSVMPAKPAAAQQPTTGVPVKISLPKLQPEDNATGGKITRGESRRGGTMIRHIDDIKRAR